MARQSDPAATRADPHGPVGRRTVCVLARLAGTLLLAAAARAEAQPRVAPEPTASTPILFVTPQDVPPAVLSWLRANREQAATTVIHDGRYTYLIATRGEKRTGGYGIRFTEVVREGNQIVARTRVSDPPRDSVVTMAITYPTAVVRIERTELSVVFRQTRGDP